MVDPLTPVPTTPLLPHYPIPPLPSYYPTFLIPHYRNPPLPHYQGSIGSMPKKFDLPNPRKNGGKRVKTGGTWKGGWGGGEGKLGETAWRGMGK